MSTLKVNTIQDTTGDTALTFDSSGNTTISKKLTSVNGNGFPSAGSLSHRNLIINGDMQVWQRSTSSTTDGYSTVDRWKTSYGGENEDPTFSKQDLTSSDTGPWEKGFRHALKVTNGNQTSTDADDYLIISQRFESQTMAQSGWDYTSASSYITLSFWVRSSVAQNFYGYLRTEDGTGQLYPFETGSLSANTWTKITKTIPGHANVQFDNNVARSCILDIWPFGGTDYSASPTLNTWANYASGTRFPANTATWWTTDDATFAITGAQLEVGETATPFEHLSYGDQLNRCLRYYYKIVCDDQGDLGVAPGWCRDTDTCHGNINFPVPMRDNPSALETSGTAGHYAVAHKTSGPIATSVPSFDSATKYSASLTVNVTGTPFTAGECGRIQKQTNDAYLAWESEL